MPASHDSAHSVPCPLSPVPFTGTRGSDASALPVHIRWMIRRDMPEVLAIEQDSFEFPWYRGGLPPLPPPAQLHRHGGRARRAGRRLHDLRAAQDQAARPEFRRRTRSSAAAASARRWSTSWSASSRSHRRRPRSCWKSARRTWPRNCSSATQGFRAVSRPPRVLRGHDRRRLRHAVPLLIFRRPRKPADTHGGVGRAGRSFRFYGRSFSRSKPSSLPR